MSATRNLSTRLRSLVRRLRLGKTRSGQVRGSGGVHSRRPLFESLEDRRLLAGDIKLWIPQDLVATPGSTVTVPVKAEVLTAGIGIGGFDAVFQFESTKLTVVGSQIGASLAAPASDILGGHDVSESNYLIYIAEGGENGTAPLPLGTIDLFTVTFTVAADAPPGASVINLLSSYDGPAQTVSTHVYDDSPHLADLDIDPAPTDAATDSIDGLLTRATWTIRSRGPAESAHRCRSASRPAVRRTTARTMRSVVTG